MLNKKAIYIIAGILLLLLFSAIGYGIYENFVWSPITKLNREFVVAWGTYSYQNYESYPEEMRKYLSAELYAEIFGDPISSSLKKASIMDDEVSTKTTFLGVKKKSRESDNFTIISSIRYQKEAKEERTENSSRGILVSWEKIATEWKVVKIEYLD